MYDVIVIGGGAAGMFASAVMLERNPSLRLLVLERGGQLLAKVRVSGGGRCNLTHVCADIREFVIHYPRGGRALIGAFHRFGPAETMAWFESHGVPVRAREDGCVFPRSDASEDVVRALVDVVRRSRAEIRTSAVVKRLHETDGCYEVLLEDGRSVRGRCVLVATGGGAFSGGLSHTIEPCVPSLFTFTTSDRAFTNLSGIVVNGVQLTGPDGLHASGELLITHRGVSGPVVLRLSSVGARAFADLGYCFDMRIHWLAGARVEEVREMLIARKALHLRQRLVTLSPFAGLPVRLWRLLLERAGAREDVIWGGCSNALLLAIAEQLTSFRVSISGKNRHREEFVTCGGVRLKEIDFKTMESRIHPGVYFAGEVLDIDALTGGYNLQAAWTTGYLAAAAIVESLQ